MASRANTILRDGKLTAQYRDQWVLCQNTERRVKKVENGKLVFYPKNGQPALATSALPNQAYTVDAIKNSLIQDYPNRRYERKGVIFRVNDVTSDKAKGIQYHLVTDRQCKNPNSSNNTKQKAQNLTVPKHELTSCYSKGWNKNGRYQRQARLYC